MCGVGGTPHPPPLAAASGVSRHGPSNVKQATCDRVNQSVCDAHGHWDQSACRAPVPCPHAWGTSTCAGELRAIKDANRVSKSPPPRQPGAVVWRRVLSSQDRRRHRGQAGPGKDRGMGRGKKDRSRRSTVQLTKYHPAPGALYAAGKRGVVKDQARAKQKDLDSRCLPALAGQLGGGKMFAGTGEARVEREMARRRGVQHQHEAPATADSARV